MFKATVGLLVVIGLLAATAVASAGNVHLKGGANAEPSFTDNGNSLSASGEIAGLGNGDVVITVVATGNVTSTCTNPAGATQPPGQNPAPITLTGVQEIPSTEVDNGNTPFNVSTTEAGPTIQGAPDCPNRRWTETIDDVAFTSATITVEQPEGNVVLTINCTFSPPTSDGAVPSGNVSCTSS